MDAIRNNAAKRRTVIECAITTLAVVCVLGTLVWSIFQSLNTPEVIFSWSTKQCIEVNYMDGTKGDCTNLPTKYDHVWGE